MRAVPLERERVYTAENFLISEKAPSFAAPQLLPRTPVSSGKVRAGAPEFLQVHLECVCVCVVQPGPWQREWVGERETEKAYSLALHQTLAGRRAPGVQCSPRKRAEGRSEGLAGGVWLARLGPARPRPPLLRSGARLLFLAKMLQSCPTLCNPRDGSPPGSLVAGIVQARTLEWVAISVSIA